MDSISQTLPNYEKTHTVNSFVSGLKKDIHHGLTKINDSKLVFLIQRFLLNSGGSSMNHRGTVDHSAFAGIVPKSLEILFQPVLEITLINLARKSVLITTSLSRSVHRIANRSDDA